MKAVDLHTHSNKSDGSLTPAQLISYAAEKQLSAIALSDHDTVEGIDEAIEAGRGKNIEVIPAIEFSTEYEGRDIHILGLYIDHHSREFEKYLQNFRDARDSRNRKMCQKLSSFGIDITYEELVDQYKGSVITRAHYAAFLMEKGYVKSRAEAFERFIGDHAPCFIPRQKVTPMQAVKLIRKAGGIPILAHPVLYHMGKEKLEKLIRELKAAGLAGLEAVYSTYNSSEERQMRQLAEKYELLISGGSDFHGKNKPGLDLGSGYGHLFIPEKILQDLKEYRIKHGKYHGSIIFADMDGTLLTDEKTISDDIYERVMNYTAQGGTFVLSSGRPIGSIIETAERLRLLLPNTYIIAYNGALIYDTAAKRPISEIRVPLKNVKEIMALAKQAGIHVHTYTDDAIVSPKNDKELEYYKIHIHLPSIISEDVTKVMKTGPYKLLAVCIKDGITLPSENRGLNTFKKMVDEAFGDSMHTFFSNVFYLECCMKEASKGNAVRFLCRHLNIPVENSVAAGDADNDISMIEAAGYGVAMLNGTDKTKKSADYITKQDNNHGGFLEVFDQLKENQDGIF